MMGNASSQPAREAWPAYALVSRFVPTQQVVFEAEVSAVSAAKSLTSLGLSVSEFFAFRLPRVSVDGYLRVSINLASRLPHLPRRSKCRLTLIPMLLLLSFIFLVDPFLSILLFPLVSVCLSNTLSE